MSDTIRNEKLFNRVMPFCPDIREVQQDVTLGKIWPVRPLRVNDFLNKWQGYV